MGKGLENVLANPGLCIQMLRMWTRICEWGAGRGGVLGLFPEAAVTNYCKLCTLKHPKLTLTILEARINSVLLGGFKASAGPGSSQGFPGEPDPCPFQHAVAASILWLEVALLQFSQLASPDLSLPRFQPASSPVCVKPPSASLKGDM